MDTEKLDTKNLIRFLMGKIRKSVMGILCVGEQYLFIKRQNFLRVFPGYTSFPGGKVESDDDSSSLKKLKSFPSNLISCLQRELLEEVSFDLFAALDNNDVVEVINIGSVVTPDFNPVRFENFYFLIILKEKPILEFDGNEISSSSWESIDSIFNRFENNEILIVPPMKKLLEGMRSNRE